MDSREAAARDQMAADDPAVQVGQIWRLESTSPSLTYMRELRVVCRYQFARPQDGRLWIVESMTSFMRFERMSELTLRRLFSLYQDVAA